MTLDQRHLHILQHTLGLDQYGRTSRGHLCPKTTFRNRFVTDKQSDDWQLCRDLVDAGLMVAYTPLAGWGRVFMVTVTGRAYVREHSPAKPARARKEKP